MDDDPKLSSPYPMAYTYTQHCSNSFPVFPSAPSQPHMLETANVPAYNYYHSPMYPSPWVMNSTDCNNNSLRWSPSFENCSVPSPSSHPPGLLWNASYMPPAPQYPNVLPFPGFREPQGPYLPYNPANSPEIPMSGTFHPRYSMYSGLSSVNRTTMAPQTFCNSSDTLPPFVVGVPISYFPAIHADTPCNASAGYPTHLDASPLSTFTTGGPSMWASHPCGIVRSDLRCHDSLTVQPGMPCNNVAKAMDKPLSCSNQAQSITHQKHGRCPSPHRCVNEHTSRSRTSSSSSVGRYTTCCSSNSPHHTNSPLLSDTSKQCSSKHCSVTTQQHTYPDRTYTADTCSRECYPSSYLMPNVINSSVGTFFENNVIGYALDAQRGMAPTELSRPGFQKCSSLSPPETMQRRCSKMELDKESSNPCSVGYLDPAQLSKKGIANSKFSSCGNFDFNSRNYIPHQRQHQKYNVTPRGCSAANPHGITTDQTTAKVNASEINTFLPPQLHSLACTFSQDTETTARSSATPNSTVSSDHKALEDNEEVSCKAVQSTYSSRTRQAQMSCAKVFNLETARPCDIANNSLAYKPTEDPHRLGTCSITTTPCSELTDRALDSFNKKHSVSSKGGYGESRGRNNKSFSAGSSTAGTPSSAAQSLWPTPPASPSTQYKKSKATHSHPSARLETTPRKAITSLETNTGEPPGKTLQLEDKPRKSYSMTPRSVPGVTDPRSTTSRSTLRLSQLRTPRQHASGGVSNSSNLYQLRSPRSEALTTSRQSQPIRRSRSHSLSNPSLVLRDNIQGMVEAKKNMIKAVRPLSPSRPSQYRFGDTHSQCAKPPNVTTQSITKPKRVSSSLGQSTASHRTTSNRQSATPRSHYQSCHQPCVLNGFKNGARTAVVYDDSDKPWEQTLRCHTPSTRRPRSVSLRRKSGPNYTRQSSLSHPSVGSKSIQPPHEPLQDVYQSQLVDAKRQPPFSPLHCSASGPYFCDQLEYLNDVTPNVESSPATADVASLTAPAMFGHNRKIQGSEERPEDCDHASAIVTARPVHDSESGCYQPSHEAHQHAFPSSSSLTSEALFPCNSGMYTTHVLSDRSLPGVINNKQEPDNVCQHTGSTFSHNENPPTNANASVSGVTHKALAEQHVFFNQDTPAVTRPEPMLQSQPQNKRVAETNTLSFSANPVSPARAPSFPIPRELLPKAELTELRNTSIHSPRPKSEETNNIISQSGSRNNTSLHQQSTNNCMGLWTTVDVLPPSHSSASCVPEDGASLSERKDVVGALSSQTELRTTVSKTGISLPHANDPKKETGFDVGHSSGTDADGTAKLDETKKSTDSVHKPHWLSQAFQSLMAGRGSNPRPAPRQPTTPLRLPGIPKPLRTGNYEVIPIGPLHADAAKATALATGRGVPLPWFTAEQPSTSHIRYRRSNEHSFMSRHVCSYPSNKTIDHSSVVQRPPITSHCIQARLENLYEQHV